MAGDPVIELRLKFAEDLDDILQCPVCMECLEGPVPLCLQGHHVCFKCQPMIDQCPFCKSQFSGTRNYLVENLMSKFKEIKASLIDPRHNLNQRIVKNKISMETQTDPNIVNGNEVETVLYSNSSNGMTVDISNDSVTPPLVGKGKYPCKIGDCKEELPHGRMISHIRYSHEGFLIDVSPSHTNEYSHKWNIQYKVNDNFDRVIHIHNMGIFFIKIFTNEEGNLHGNVQIVNTRLVAQGFQYQLEIGNDSTRTYHKGMVLACRTISEKITNNCLFIHSISMQNLLKRNETYDCFLKITRLLKKG